MHYGETALVHEFDTTLETSRKLVMVSRPRRFGKSYAAQSIVAFYSIGCDSRSLFSGREVSRFEGWDARLNQYNVISLDMAEVMQAASEDDAVSEATSLLLPELREIVPAAGRLHEGKGVETRAAIQDVPVLLVGVTYDPKTRRHSCRIELSGEV